MYKLGRHLFSGCAESVGMLYSIFVEGDALSTFWLEEEGSQDWSTGESSTKGKGENFS
jgi:hypothetical protein